MNEAIFTVAHSKLSITVNQFSTILVKSKVINLMCNVKPNIRKEIVSDSYGIKHQKISFGQQSVKA